MKASLDQMVDGKMGKQSHGWYEDESEKVDGEDKRHDSNGRELWKW